MKDFRREQLELKLPRKVDYGTHFHASGNLQEQAKKIWLCSPMTAARSTLEKTPKKVVSKPTCIGREDTNCTRRKRPATTNFHFSPVSRKPSTMKPGQIDFNNKDFGKRRRAGCRGIKNKTFPLRILMDLKFITSRKSQYPRQAQIPLPLPFQTYVYPYRMKTREHGAYVPAARLLQQWTPLQTPTTPIPRPCRSNKGPSL